MKNLIGIVDGKAVKLCDDPWSLLPAESASGKAILALGEWRDMVFDLQREFDYRQYGIILDPDDDPKIIDQWVDKIPVIVLRFPSFRDGRAYSQASLLRTRYGYRGDLRAVGDVLRDQLALMRHCGFSSFYVREDKSVEDALKGLGGLDKIYARSVIQPEPRFRSR
ncbi:DUF934 domain-containing protein [Alcanivorax jadensis]|uniref:DUF934 domain-containing protein n=1 Tax=Alcanivorax jadensis TaxID=64988 RepID=UPI002409A179|nr:DUF934 domain-containing protein [Alcanivorax jadensis]MDF1639060.1 DUF934 domain-containing protein [Alcanivorax jadensis]